MFGKSALLEAIAGKNRGLLATDGDRQSILAAVVELEERNPTPRPLEALDKLDGNWRLLFTTSKGLLNIDQVPFCKLGQIYQYVRASSASIYNVAEIYGLPYLEGIVSVAAKFEALSEKRAKVNFERSIIGLQRLVDYRSVDHFIEQVEAGQKFRAIDFNITNREQRGWLDVTYLDDDLRIGRGNEGSVFVLTKA
jgi:PAP_fibrillin